MCWGAGLALLHRLRRPRPPGQDDALGGGDLAVIVPARNEERSLPVLLRSLAAQSPPPAEMVVVDDTSEDATATVAREWGARVVGPGPVPPGWTGKTWACRAGVEATVSPLLVFLDADTQLAPGALAHLVAEHRRQGCRGLLSPVPEHVGRRPHERLSALCQLVAIMGTGAFAPSSRWGVTPSAFGPCLVCRRADYHAVGGHGSVRAEMAEDMALARRFRSHGQPVRVVAGKGVVRVRMYPDGISQLVRGWSRTLASGALVTRPLTFVMVVAWLSGLISAAWGAGRGLAAVAAGHRREGVCRLAPYAAYALQVEWLLSRTTALGSGTGLAYPAPLVTFLVCFARSSALRAGVGRTRWKGRGVAVTAAEGAACG